MKITIKNALAFLTFVGTVSFALPVFAQTNCPDFGYMKLGGENNADEVRNVQTFLKARESLDVDVTGIFDDKTEKAVEAFQNKYMDEVMAPWGATRVSGAVNLTTVKKIKQILCGEPLSLNAHELYAIASYNSVGGGNSYAADYPGVNNDDLSLIPTASAEDGAASSQTAAVGSSGGASLIHRFLSFLKNIF